MKVPRRPEDERERAAQEDRLHAITTENAVLGLQRGAGNQAVARLLRDRRDARTLSRTFAGTYGGSFTHNLSPAALGDANATVNATDPRLRIQALLRDTQYAALWNSLHTFPEAIQVEPKPLNAYDAENRTLRFLPGMMLDVLGMVNGSKDFDATTFGTHLSAIVHEFTHANDHLIKKREFPSLSEVKEEGSKMGAHVRGVLDTELRAWAREAISASEVATQTASTLDPDRAQLLASWKAVTPQMGLSSAAIRQHAPGNEVIKRTLRYTEREFTSLWVSKDLPFWRAKADAWFNDNDNAAWLRNHTADMRTLVEDETA